MKLNCIAVDDEPLALGMISAFIEQTPFLQLVGRYSSAVEALQVIHQQSIDVIFLDIQMPDLSGIELARVLDKGEYGVGPRIIFTTAFSQYALEGYKVDALDYLVKPFNYADFLKAASKAQAYAELLQKATPALPTVTTAGHEDEYLFLKVEYQLVRIAFQDILYMEGLKDYVKVHLQNNTKPVLSLTSLKALEEKLPARRFMRVHRSFIVALDKITAVSRNKLQIGETNIAVSEQYKDAFNQFLSRWT
ncbi:LytTR family two component transcriptional regulator [Pontibacter ummariensis]|uniref:Two component transcriptional regulator, LytTR family n=1 Tax=Pontibacter ummariensis TaxID=1610492 RepID=A0A239FQL9_9BACT|nr:LytTR family DNA-binding domain-containing protein [Pontibacter ummariensis]PRY11965.1 LytTR family two component transcriptional regulator [Pontibacter ummariensis]SNS59181.1 two component transcriptional regulator, LytTR family [Pontibacter ummariensis]